jgi:hypothetical protein
MANLPASPVVMNYLGDEGDSTMIEPSMMPALMASSSD